MVVGGGLHCAGLQVVYVLRPAHVDLDMDTPCQQSQQRCGTPGAHHEDAALPVVHGGPVAAPDLGLGPVLVQRGQEAQRHVEAGHRYLGGEVWQLFIRYLVQTEGITTILRRDVTTVLCTSHSRQKEQYTVQGVPGPSLPPILELTRAN